MISNTSLNVLPFSQKKGNLRRTQFNRQTLYQTLTMFLLYLGLAYFPALHPDAICYFFICLLIYVLFRFIFFELDIMHKAGK